MTPTMVYLTEALSPQFTRNTGCWLSAQAHTTREYPKCKLVVLLEKRSLEHTSSPYILWRGFKFPRQDITQQEEKSSKLATIYSTIRSAVQLNICHRETLTQCLISSLLFLFLSPPLIFRCSSAMTSFLWHCQMWLRALYTRVDLTTYWSVCSSYIPGPGDLSLASLPLGTMCMTRTHEKMHNRAIRSGGNGMESLHSLVREGTRETSPPGKEKLIVHEEAGFSNYFCTPVVFL